MTGRPPNTVDGALRRYVVCGAHDDCWPWRGNVQPNGYGRVYIAKRQWLAHRLVYEALVGRIDDGMVIDHLCRRRDCVNPAHLEPVTNGVNILRGQGVGAVNARKSACKRGHEFTRATTGLDHRRDRYCRPCERELRRYYTWRRKTVVIW